MPRVQVWSACGKAGGNRHATVLWARRKPLPSMRAPAPASCFSDRRPLRVISPDIRRYGRDRGFVGPCFQDDSQTDGQTGIVRRRQHRRHLHAGMAEGAAGTFPMPMVVRRKMRALIRRAKNRQRTRRRHDGTRPSRYQRLDCKRQHQQEAEKASRLSVCNDPARECHAQGMPQFASPVIATSCAYRRLSVPNQPELR